MNESIIPEPRSSRTNAADPHNLEGWAPTDTEDFLVRLIAVWVSLDDDGKAALRAEVDRLVFEERVKSIVEGAQLAKLPGMRDVALYELTTGHELIYITRN